jgi:hypothetical protein
VPAARQAQVALTSCGRPWGPLCLLPSLLILVTHWVCRSRGHCNRQVSPQGCLGTVGALLGGSQTLLLLLQRWLRPQGHLALLLPLEGSKADV